MTRHGFIPVILLAVSMVCCVMLYQGLAEKRQKFLDQDFMGYVLPSSAVRPVSFEFRGIVSDFLFLKISTFLGAKFIKRQLLEEKHAQFLYDYTDTITDLDPWFWDAYLVADMILSWDFKRIRLANTLLFKAEKYKPHDFRVPYQIGFNYFYFLKDNARGAKYLMKASALPGSPAYLPSLAARLSMYQNQYGPAIVFLKQTLAKVRNRVLKKQFQMRLDTLVLMAGLEKKVHEYKAKFGVYPETLSDLVKKNMIKSIPDDPYGGKFILLKNKRVYTTSKMIRKWK